MTVIRFTKATQDDVAMVTDCITAAYAKARETIDDLPDVTSNLAEEIAEHCVVLAHNDDGLKGVIIYAQQGTAMKVLNLAVSPLAQGQGIAGILLSRAEADACKAGCTHMELRTHRLMQDTRAIYAHLGWVEIEVSGNTVAMRKDL
ncbi:GNAT family N-acetyltransferase [Ruegeria denitrificans]|uniref:GNAT family N-acetyltransferase n=1 Tax=Ruegeria denitrificans TaxID=1715692 RepID=UPI00071DF0B6|nr:GNAT family N-acetyltransferase [Ruegeria denitrificans]